MIADLYYYVKTLFKKKPENVMKMVGIDDLAKLWTTEMENGMKSFNNWTLSCIPCIIISEIVTSDEKNFFNGRNKEFKSALMMMNLEILTQHYITHLGKRGLRLDFEGNRQLANNIVQKTSNIKIQSHFESCCEDSVACFRLCFKYL